MQRLMQHNMIKMGEGEVHPLFRLDYLPENLASFIETIVIVVEGYFGLIFLSGLLLQMFYPKYTESALGFILNGGLNQVFAAVHVQNSVISNATAFMVVVVVFLISRRYFEYAKYNLHMLRNMDKALFKQTASLPIREGKVSGSTCLTVAKRRKSAY